MCTKGRVWIEGTPRHFSGGRRDSWEQKILVALSLMLLNTSTLQAQETPRLSACGAALGMKTADIRRSFPDLECAYPKSITAPVRCYRFATGPTPKGTGGECGAPALEVDFTLKGGRLEQATLRFARESFNDIRSSVIARFGPPTETEARKDAYPFQVREEWATESEQLTLTVIAHGKSAGAVVSIRPLDRQQCCVRPGEVELNRR